MVKKLVSNVKQLFTKGEKLFNAVDYTISVDKWQKKDPPMALGGSKHNRKKM